MKPRRLLKVSVQTTPEAEEAVSEVMGTVLEQTPSSYQDIETNDVFVTTYLERATLSAVAKSALIAGLSRVRECGLDVGPAQIVVQQVEHKDWAEAWKRHFKPISLGSALLVKPSWNRRKPRRGQAVLILDPGLSFGTGQHPTTWFCLQQLVAARRGKGFRSFLDIGTGSGILAIAAAKLGCRRIEAFDFDPESIRVARANARGNRVLPRIQFARKDLTRLSETVRQKFDLVCANLTSDLLLAERSRIVGRVQEGGTLVLAGILHSQFGEVAAAYQQSGWKLRAHKVEREWESGAFSRS